MGIKKIILGEPMPDENDPKYKERAQRDRKAGEQFAHAVVWTGWQRSSNALPLTTTRYSLESYLALSFSVSVLTSTECQGQSRIVRNRAVR